MRHATLTRYCVCLSLIAAALAVVVGSPVPLLAQETRPPNDVGESSFASQAAEIVADLAAERFDPVYELFDPTMRDMLSEAGLANAWRTYQELLGAFQSADQPSLGMQGDLIIAQIPVQLARGDGEVRIVFHPDGTLAGLFFRCAEGVRC